MTRLSDERIAWDRVDELIERTPQDGIGADGAYHDTVFREQRKFVDGMRFARLSIIRTLTKIKDIHHAG